MQITSCLRLCTPKHDIQNKLWWSLNWPIVQAHNGSVLPNLSMKGALGVTVNQTLESYSAAWGEPDAGKRAAILSQCWAEEGSYLDPSAHVEGRDALCAHIGEVLEKLPGARIELTSDISCHHGRLYFSWQLVSADGNVIIAGVDFGVLDAEGQIAQIVGFFNPPVA